jgi:hypothetical protein
MPKASLKVALVENSPFGVELVRRVAPSGCGDVAGRIAMREASGDRRLRQSSENLPIDKRAVCYELRRHKTDATLGFTKPFSRGVQAMSCGAPIPNGFCVTLLAGRGDKLLGAPAIWPEKGRQFRLPALGDFSFPATLRWSTHSNLLKDLPPSMVFARQGIARSRSAHPLKRRSFLQDGVNRAACLVRA